jgi:hypothetical protein
VSIRSTVTSRHVGPPAAPEQHSQQPVISEHRGDLISKSERISRRALDIFFRPTSEAPVAEDR